MVKRDRGGEIANMMRRDERVSSEELRLDDDFQVLFIDHGVSVSKDELSRLAFRLVQNVKNVTFIYASYAQVEEYLQRMVSLPEKLYA